MAHKEMTSLNVPGVMLYLDMESSLQTMNYTEKGKLLDAMLQYARYGTVPELNRRIVPVWEILRARIDRDMLRYADTIWQRRYAVYTRERRKKGLEVDSYEDWYAKVKEDYAICDPPMGNAVTDEALMTLWQQRRAGCKAEG